MLNVCKHCKKLKDEHDYDDGWAGDYYCNGEMIHFEAMDNLEYIEWLANKN
jgi:hypothetical protein